MTGFGNSGQRVKTEDGLMATGTSASEVKIQHRSLLIERGYEEFTAGAVESDGKLDRVIAKAAMT